MARENDVSTEMQQVSAYPTKQEMHQKDVALLEGEDCECQTKQTRATESEQG